MVIKQYFQKRKLLKNLEKAREAVRNSSDDVSPDGLARIARAYGDEADVLVHLGVETGDRKYFREALQKYSYALDVAGKSSDGGFSRRYKTDIAELRKVLEEREGKDKSWYAKEGDIDPNVKEHPTGLIVKPKSGDSDDGKDYHMGLIISDEAWEALVKRNPELRDKKNHTRKKGLEATLAIIGISTGLYFLYPNITANAIADLAGKSISLAGACLLIMGLIASYLFVKK